MSVRFRSKRMGSRAVSTARLFQFLLGVSLQFQEALGAHRVLTEAYLSVAQLERQKAAGIFSLTRKQRERGFIAVHEPARHEFL